MNIAAYLPEILFCVYRSLILNGIGLSVVMTLCSFIGLVIFATYWECDPVKNKVTFKTLLQEAYFV